MKKINFKKILKSKRDYFLRLKKSSKFNKSVRERKKRLQRDEVRRFNASIEISGRNGVTLEFTKGSKVIVHLPVKMNFSRDYEITAKYLNVIRRLVDRSRRYRGSYRLMFVNFEYLKKISTSAALVLTAELSLWESSIRKHLKPRTENWDTEILRKFSQLGFFEIFDCESPIQDAQQDGRINLVKYIKGLPGEKSKARLFGERLQAILGKEIEKWAFLHSGLTEAIINVGHHAYPSQRLKDEDRAWYMGGSFDSETRELKVTFYDQGIGIPRSLPSSKLWEIALDFLKIFPVADRKRDEIMIKAAMELDRSRTEENDRGKGLQDVLEFVRQRSSGLFSIFSLKGLYKYEAQGGASHVKTVNFSEPVRGTLIIWKVTLDKVEEAVYG